MRSMHGRFPHMPFYIAGKELRLRDARLSLDKVPDRLFEHPATVFVLTNMYYAEARWLTPVRRRRGGRSGTKSRCEGLVGEFEAQIAERGPFLTNWQANVSPRSGMPIYEGPVALVMYRRTTGSCSNRIIPRAGRSEANFDLVIASRPYRANLGQFPRQTHPSPTPAGVAGRGAPDWYSLPRSGSGLEIIQAVWPGENPFAVAVMSYCAQ